MIETILFRLFLLFIVGPIVYAAIAAIAVYFTPEKHKSTVEDAFWFFFVAAPAVLIGWTVISLSTGLYDLAPHKDHFWGGLFFIVVIWTVYGIVKWWHNGFGGTWFGDKIEYQSPYTGRTYYEKGDPLVKIQVWCCMTIFPVIYMFT